jgi:hypothetical protein
MLRQPTQDQRPYLVVQVLQRIREWEFAAGSTGTPKLVRCKGSPNDIGAVEPILAGELFVLIGGKVWRLRWIRVEGDELVLSHAPSQDEVNFTVTTLLDSASI